MKNLFNVLVVLIVNCISTLLMSTGLAQTIVVDNGRIINTNIDQKLGLNLNFVVEENSSSLQQSVDDLQLTSLRFQEGDFGDFWMFNVQNPDRAIVTVNDDSLYWYPPFTEDGFWEDNLDLPDFSDLLDQTNTQGYAIIGIDAIIYEGTQDQALLAMSTSERVAKIKQAAVDFVTYVKANNINITHWEIGNETDLDDASFSGIGVWDAAEYAQVVADIAQAMKAADPTIKIGVHGGLKGDAETDAWLSQILPVVRNHVDFVVSHQYAFWMSGYDQWRTGDFFQYNDNVRRINDGIANYAPELSISVTEFSGWVRGSMQHWYGLNTLNMIGKAMLYPKVEDMHLWTSQWFGQEQAQAFYNSQHELTPVGQAVKLFTNHARPTLADTGEVSRVVWFHTKDEASGDMTTLLINRETFAQTVQIEINDPTGSTQHEIWQMRAVGDDPLSSQANTTLASPVTVEEENGVRKMTVTLPPVSASALRFDGESTTVFDPLGNLDLVNGDAASAWRTLTFKGDEVIERRSATAQSVVYAYDDIVSFLVRVQNLPGFSVPNTVNFYTSSDSVTWEPIAARRVAQDSIGGGWFSDTYEPTATIPTNSRYFRIAFSATNVAWNPKLSEVALILQPPPPESPAEREVVINARMLNGSSDELQLWMNDQVEKTWTIQGNSYAEYTHTTSQEGNVKLVFADNGTDLEVDWLKIGESTYQAEAQAVNTSVWQNGSCGGSNSQRMHCAGYIDFGTISEEDDPNCSEIARTAASYNQGADEVMASPELIVYPNPARNEAQIHLPYEQPAMLHVLDLTGRIVLEATLSRSQAIDIQTLPGGLYTVKVQQKGAIMSKKLLVKW